MRRVLLLLVLLFIFFVISTSFYFKNISAQENQSVSDSSSVIVEKLDMILKNQTAILSQIEDMKQEIRARCTR